MAAEIDETKSRPTSTWSKMIPTPSGRQDHWTDRVAVQVDYAKGEEPSFLPNAVAKKIRYSLDSKSGEWVATTLNVGPATVQE